MKKFYLKLIPFIILAFLALSLPTIILAKGTTPGYFESIKGKLETAGGQAGYGDETPPTPAVVAAGIVKILLGGIGIIFLGLMIYGGYLWMTAHGNEEKVTKAKDIIKNSIIGLAVVLSAYAITYFLFAYFEGASGGVG